MFLYEKKILYLSFYRGGRKETGSGFVRFTEKTDELRMDIQVKKSCCREDGSYLLRLLVGDEKPSLGELSVQAGGINASRYFKADEEKIYIQGTAYDKREVYGVRVEINRECCIAGYIKEKRDQRTEETKPERQEELKQEKQETKSWREEGAKEKEEKDEPSFRAAGMEEPLLGKNHTEVRCFDNKWDQLLNEYPQIHPFGDERTFISIEPRDFIILSAPFQKLVNNSFLLHGFYNYRYLILGPDKELGEGSGECFYLGVPGTFFEREKMVAVMFGFEGFECDGPVEVGQFGYYLRRVEL